MSNLINYKLDIYIKYVIYSCKLYLKDILK